MTTEPFDKTINPGANDCGHMYCRIRYENRNGGMELAITGVEGPMRNGDAKGGSGQIVMSGLTIDRFSAGWTRELLDEFAAVWDRWHLNRMKAGTPAQEAWLRDHPWDRQRDGDHYTWAEATLAAAGLQPDGDYSYGSAWLAEEVPDEILAWLQALPDTAREPAWV